MLPPVQVAFETFCSFAVNSRGSLRTEIRPGPGLAAGSIPSARPGCPWARPAPVPAAGSAPAALSDRGEQGCPGVPALSPSAATLDGLRCQEQPKGF